MSNTSNANVSFSISPAPSKPVVGSVRPSVAGSKLEPMTADASAQLNRELLQLVVAELSEQDVRTQLRLLAIKFAGAIGVAHIVSSPEGNWRIATGQANGRVSTSDQFIDRLQTRCVEVYERQTIQVDSFDEPEGSRGIFVPIRVQDQAPEILLLVVSSKREPQAAILVAQQIKNVLESNLKRIGASQLDWKVHSLAAMVELVSKIESCSTVESAMSLAANELSRYLGISIVGIGKLDRRERIKQIVLAGSDPLERRSAAYHAYQQCLAESRLRDQLAVWPAEKGRVGESNDELLLAHRQLASTLQVESILSVPLGSVDGSRFGSWLFAGTREQIQSDRLERFLSAVSPRVTSALQVVDRSQHPAWLRLVSSLPRQLSKRSTQLVCLALIGLTAAMFIPVPYRVRCHCSVEPGLRRFAVVPFEGTVLKGFVQPGDPVQEGQVLAEMDGRSLRFELAELSAKSSIAEKQRAIELADREIANMLMAELDGKRINAEQELLDYKRKHLQIKSPIAGIVLSGSLEQAEASSFQTGDVLFEIGSISKQRIQMEVPADEVAQIDVGHPVTVWFEGRESIPVRGTIERIRPQSEKRNASNVFIAEFVVEADSAQLRPGMQGSARIDGNVHSLGWNLFHKPVDFLRSRLTW